MNVEEVECWSSDGAGSWLALVWVANTIHMTRLLQLENGVPAY